MARPRLPAYRPLFSILFLWMGACSDSSGPEEALAPLVGTWRAEALVLTNKANPSQVVDLVAEGAVFTISILGNGQYSATLDAFGQSLPPELGTITVQGSKITIAPTGGAPTTGTWALQNGKLLVDGDTEFDFNQDGIREDATIHMQLARVSS